MRYRCAPILLAMFVLAGCDGYQTTTAPNTYELRIEGSIGAYPQGTHQPVRILFVVDSSQSMVVTDPATDEEPGRVRATRDIIDRYVGDRSVAFGLVRFEASARALTGQDEDGDMIPDTFFTRDRRVLDDALAALAPTGGNTSYDSALSMAELVLTGEIESQNIDERARARYHVVFLTDGLPYPQDFEDELNTPARARQLVESIVHLKERFGLAELRVHCALLSVNTPDIVYEEAHALLTGLAEIGGGEYLEFRSGDEIDFSRIDFFPNLWSPLPAPFLALNLSATPGPDGPLPDSDLDGLADEYELGLALDPANADSDDDGFGDLIELLLSGAYDPGWGNPCVGREDRDGDGLTACEEVELNLDVLEADTDGDGFGDLVEILRDSHPLIRQPDEKLWGDDLARTELLEEGDGVRMAFAAGLPLVPTLTGGNVVLVWADTHPGSLILHPTRFRTACVWVEEPFPATSLSIELLPSDFAPADELRFSDPQTSCVRAR